MTKATTSYGGTLRAQFSSNYDIGSRLTSVSRQIGAHPPTPPELGRQPSEWIRRLDATGKSVQSEKIYATEKPFLQIIEMRESDAHPVENRPPPSQAE
jgi:hypothetical protein